MLKCFRAMFGLHECHWTIIKTIDVYGDRTDMPVAYEYVLQCTICGDVTKREV